MPPSQRCRAGARDDRPFGSRAPPVALYYASRDRRHEHPARHLAGFTGILQADAYSGYNELYKASRAPGPIIPALCWAHARRQFFELADIAANTRRGKNAVAISQIALEAVKRIDALFDIERGINGLSAEERLRGEKVRRWWPLLRPGCANSARACRTRPQSPSRPTICSSVGKSSHDSSTTAESVLRTMRRNERCADLRSAGGHGSSPAPNAAPIERQPWQR